MKNLQPILEQIKLLNSRMEDSYTHGRFDTFCHLAAERLKLLRGISADPGGKEHRESLRQQTEQWIVRIEKRLCKEKAARTRRRIAAGGRIGRKAPTGRIVNQNG